MHVNSGKPLGILGRPFGFSLNRDVRNRLASLLQDMDDIERGTAAHADQHQLHGAWSWRAPLRSVSRSKHDFMPGPRFTDEGAVLNPLDACFHSVPQRSAILPIIVYRDGLREFRRRS